MKNRENGAINLGTKEDLTTTKAGVFRYRKREQAIEGYFIIQQGLKSRRDSSAAAYRSIYCEQRSVVHQTGSKKANRKVSEKRYLV